MAMRHLQLRGPVRGGTLPGVTTAALRKSINLPDQHYRAWLKNFFGAKKTSVGTTRVVHPQYLQFEHELFEDWFS